MLAGRSVRPSLNRLSQALNWSCRPFSAADASSKLNHYELLGVSHLASVTEIKTAFRAKAKEVHPDTKNADGKSHADRLAFIQVLQAYQVLTNARERQLYDLKLDPRSGRLAEEAVKETPESPSRSKRHQPIQEEWMRPGSWAEWAANAPAPRQNQGHVGRVQAKLQQEFRQALRHAYLGPSLELEIGHLPDRFEGDERSDGGTDDILHLVSGRTLLGIVREQTHLYINDSQDSQKQLRKAKLYHQGQSESPNSANTQNSAEFMRKTYSSHDPCYDDSEAIATDLGDPKTRHLHRHNKVLELSIDGDISGYGARQLQRDGHMKTLFFDAAGHLLAQECQGRLSKVDSYLSAGQNGSDLRSTHEIFRVTTPFVRHIDFVGLNGKERISVCKCRRAWLPPSHIWLFPPRSEQHKRRSWYFEWPGHQASHHPLWLPPCIFVLAAAFESLEDEDQAKRKQLQSLFHRARRWVMHKLGLL